MTEIKKKRNDRKRGGKKKFDWNSGKQTKQKDMKLNKVGIPIEGERLPRKQVFPGGNSHA